MYLTDSSVNEKNNIKTLILFVEITGSRKMSKPGLFTSSSKEKCLDQPENNAAVSFSLIF